MARNHTHTDRSAATERRSSRKAAKELPIRDEPNRHALYTQTGCGKPRAMERPKAVMGGHKVYRTKQKRCLHRPVPQDGMVGKELRAGVGAPAAVALTLLV